MSLTFLYRYLLLVALAAATVTMSWLYAPPMVRQFLEARVSTTQQVRFDSRALVYRLAGERPLSFVFSQPVQQLKIIVQPSVREAARGRAAGFVYRLRVRLLDAEGQAIAQYEKYLHSQSPDDVFASGEVWRFFRDRPEVVAGQDELVIASDRPAVSAELSVVEADDGVVGVEVRVYEQRPLLDSQTRATFLRRSDEEQRNLAEANAFPPDMLTDSEISHLVRNMWRPVGPHGIEGRDYTALVLYEAARFRDGPVPLRGAARD